MKCERMAATILSSSCLSSVSLSLLSSSSVSSSLSSSSSSSASSSSCCLSSMVYSSRGRRVSVSRRRSALNNTSGSGSCLRTIHYNSTVIQACGVQTEHQRQRVWGEAGRRKKRSVCARMADTSKSMPMPTPTPVPDAVEENSETINEQSTAPGAVRLWGGRFSGTSSVDPRMDKLNQSLPFDKRMFAEDVLGSQAYAKALNRCGLLQDSECDEILSGLDSVREEWQQQHFKIAPGDEDIHTANERRLSELIGSNIGGKLHTGRSRNDQVATDTRLWLLKTIHSTRCLIRKLIEAAACRAEAEVDVIMPGFTHLQPAQAIRWSHWLMQYAACWQRDDMRLKEAAHRMAMLPLGSGAIAGNPFKVDRKKMAEELGFYSGVCPNSMDAVSDRDFILDTMYAGSMFMTHVSRFAEDLIIYSTAQFDMVSLSEMYRSVEMAY